MQQSQISEKKFITLVNELGFLPIGIEITHSLSHDHRVRMTRYWAHSDGMFLVGKFENSKLIGSLLSFNFKYNRAYPVYIKETTCQFKKDLQIAIGTTSMCSHIDLVIHDIKKHGSLINPWIEPPFKWIIDPDDKFINDTIIDRTKLRISMFPTWVQKMINYSA